MNILFAVLNMGLGHATRSLGLINALLESDAKVVVVSTGRSLILLQSELKKWEQQVEFIDVPDYDLEYSRKIPLILKMAGQIPSFLRKIRTENAICQSLMTRYQIDLIVSDHRYGFYHPDIKSFLLTHQLTIMSPGGLNFTKPLSFRIHKHLLKKFNCIIVPDFEGTPSLSGELSHGDWVRGLNIFFSGPLVTIPEDNKQSQFDYDIVTIVSGPEPQRSVFENTIIDVLNDSDEKTAIVLGRPESKDIRREGNVDIYSFMDRNKIIQLINGSKLVISRSGYTTAMELAALQRKAVFVPTPGQTEQEYLAKYYDSLKWHKYIRQTHIREIPSLLPDISSHISGFPGIFDPAENYRTAADYILNFKGQE